MSEPISANSRPEASSMPNVRHQRPFTSSALRPSAATGLRPSTTAACAAKAQRTSSQTPGHDQRQEAEPDGQRVEQHRADGGRDAARRGAQRAADAQLLAAAQALDDRDLQRGHERR